MPRVLWKCSANGTSGQRSRTRPIVRSTCNGFAMPVVSAIITSSAPRSSRASATIPSTFFSESSMLIRMFFRLKVSLAASTTITRSGFVSRARSVPRTFGTSGSQATPGTRSRPAMTCSASAICGTALGLTNDVTSMRVRPVCARRLAISILCSVGTNAPRLWMPSRVPTSRMVTRAGKLMPRPLLIVLPEIVPGTLRGQVTGALCSHRAVLCSLDPFGRRNADGVRAAALRPSMAAQSSSSISAVHSGRSRTTDIASSGRSTSRQRPCWRTVATGTTRTSRATPRTTRSSGCPTQPPGQSRRPSWRQKTTPTRSAPGVQRGPAGDRRARAWDSNLLGWSPLQPSAVALSAGSVG